MITYLIILTIYMDIRIEKLEWFDEFEEWNLMQKHYYVSLCSKGEEVPKVVIKKDEGKTI